MICSHERIRSFVVLDILISHVENVALLSGLEPYNSNIGKNTVLVPTPAGWFYHRLAMLIIPLDKFHFLSDEYLSRRR